jgi:hypothetical protein
MLRWWTPSQRVDAELPAGMAIATDWMRSKNIDTSYLLTRFDLIAPFKCRWGVLIFLRFYVVVGNAGVWQVTKPSFSSALRGWFFELGPPEVSWDLSDSAVKNIF